MEEEIQSEQLGPEPSVDDLRDLISYIAKQLVDEPDAVEVHAMEEGRALVLELTVAPDDVGKVIGREGRTARAMRTLLSAMGSRIRKRAILDILE